MRAKDTKRAAMLVEAHDGLADLRREGKRKKPDRYDGDGLACEIAFVAYCESGSTSYAYIYLPPDALAHMIDAAETFIGDELAKLGVDVP